MTIAAGFIHREGVLLCADTEHTGWTWKVQGAKLGHLEYRGGKVGWGYAGNTGFALSAIQECARQLEGIEAVDALPRIRKVLWREYKRNVLDHPDHATDASLHYNLLICLWSTGEMPRLYVTTQTALREVDAYDCIGIGESIAHFLIRPSFIAGLSERGALNLATHVLAGAKDYVPGCGGASYFISIRNDGLIKEYDSIRTGHCRRLEAYSNLYEIKARRLLLAMADSGINDAQFEEYLTGVFNPQILEIRHAWTAEKQARIKEFSEVMRTEPIDPEDL